MRYQLVRALVFVLLCSHTAFAQSISSAVALYNSGKIGEADREFSAVLGAAEGKEAPEQVWNILIGYAWFLDEIGEHRRAIELSNRALEIASQKDHPFMIGRSLSWLGWAYTGLGLYDVALSFYQNAVEIAAPGGKVQLMHVWGLSTQELGALYYKMGRVIEGRKYLEQALAVARDNKVGPGISEGAAHLAELSLTEGKYDEAERLAREAVKWGEHCQYGCTPYNTMHARVILSKVLFEIARLDTQRMPDAVKQIRDTLEASEKAGLKRCVAESSLLLARAMPASQFEERYALTTRAFEILATMESELRGTAESELGKLHMENADVKLAEFYLKNGYKVNKELFRRVDNSFVIDDLAVLSSVKGDVQASIRQMKTAVDEALAANNLPLATASLSKLAATYLELGYDALAIKASKKGLSLLEALSKGIADEAIKRSLQSRKLELSTIYAEASLNVMQASGQISSPS